MSEIQIRTGSSMRALLQTTVGFDNLFTELVKNSLQNNATLVRINFNDKFATVLDNGTGFDHVKDESGLNEFEKYFVYGSSFTKSDKRLNLGQMGIGGKAANDKLSDLHNTHWEIETVNKRGAAFRLTFKSTGDEKYLNQIKPIVTEIHRKQCKVPPRLKTGCIITIFNLNKQLITNGWPEQDIINNLQLFFNMLHFQSKNVNFKLFVNNKPINFSNQLPGKPWKHGTFNFPYMMDGEKKTSSYKLMLNIVPPRYKHFITSTDIISYTRVGKFPVDIQYLKEIFDKKKWAYISANDVVAHFQHNIRGYIICEDISDVRDSTGLGAKDLTHHRLNPDHPLTKPFIRDITRKLYNWVSPVLNHQRDPDVKMERIINNVASIVYKNFNIPDKFITEKENTITRKVKIDG